MNPELAAAIHSGPARDLYRSLGVDAPMSRRWLEEVRRLWGNPHHPSQELFTEIGRQSLSLPSCQQGIRCEAELFSPADPRPGAVVYLHGGGWIAPMAGKHLGWARRISALTQRRVYALHYRLAPEHPFPAALLDAAGAVLAVREHHGGPMVAIGDSAGANLAAACHHWLMDVGEQGLQQLTLICGVMDLELERHQSMLTLGIDHPYNSIEVLAYERSLYLPDASRWTDPLASPLRGDLKRLPATVVIAAEHDPLRDDNLDFAEAAKNQGANVTVHVGEAMPHGFVMQHELVPTAAAAAEAVILNALG